LINNKTAVTIDSSRLLSKAFGQSPQFWINLDTNYRLRLKEVNAKIKDAEIKALIYKYMPIAEMIKKAWLPEYSSVKDLISNVKSFWGIDNLDFFFLDKHPLPNFKKSNSFENYTEYYAAAWYNMARICSASVSAPKFNRRLLTAFAEKLPDFSLIDDGVSLFIEELFKSGVKFIVLSHLSKTYIDGASFKQGDNRIIMYSARHDRLDNFWFTMAHEIAHVLLHITNDKDCFIDNLEDIDSVVEREANDLALNFIKANVILDYFKDFGRYISEQRVIRCSSDLGIGKAVIVGVLQYNGKLPRRNLNKFKQKVSPLIPERCFVEKG